MEKDIDKISKNPDTDIVIRIDDFGGKVGLTIREFVRSERYTGFTKSGTRIPAEKFAQFKAAINSIDEAELAAEASSSSAESSGKTGVIEKKEEKKETQEKSEETEKAEDDFDGAAI